MLIERFLVIFINSWEIKFVLKKIRNRNLEIKDYKKRERTAQNRYSHGFEF